MIRNQYDVASVRLVITIFFVQLLLFFYVHSLWLVVVIVIGLLPFQGSASACNHNHHHRNMFQSDGLNRLFEMVLYLQTGTSPYSWTLHHIIGHHQNYLEPVGDSSPWIARDGNVMSRWYYCFRNTLMIYPESWRIGWGHPKIFRRFLVMFFISNGFLGVFFVIDPLKTSIIFIIPMVLMLFYLVDTTYTHHVGLDRSTAFSATNNCLNPIFNICAWNLGYHTAHHIKPGLHWSDLPAFHDTIRDKIPNNQITYNWGPSLVLRYLKGVLSR